MATIIKADKWKVQLTNAIKTSNNKYFGVKCYVCTDEGDKNNFVIDYFFDKNILANFILRKASYEVYEIFKVIVERELTGDDPKLLIVYTQHLEDDITILENMMDRLEEECDINVIIVCDRYK